MKLWRYGHAIEYLGQRYRLEGTLGSGGMADVCLAWDEHEACAVAIKVIKSDQLEQRALDRFIKEAAQVARWQHPNILRIYSDLKLELLDAAQGSIVPYIVMEYAQGGDLHKRLTPGEPYPFAATLDLFAQLCSAVAYAHEHGVIHRDLKPLNILFRQLPGDCEQVVLSDFGLAVDADATHHTFAHGGTLLYMAPEQFRGHALPASDIFALGVIFYQLCTGRLPFRRNLQELHLLNSAIPTPPSFIVPALPEALDDIILTALAPDPEQRYPTASALWEAIHAVVYSSHLKPAYNTIPRRSSGTTSPRPAISRRTAPRRAIHPITQPASLSQTNPRLARPNQGHTHPIPSTPAQRAAALNSFSAQLDIAADSQDLPPPTDLAPHTSHPFTSNVGPDLSQSPRSTEQSSNTNVRPDLSRSPRLIEQSPDSNVGPDLSRSPRFTGQKRPSVIPASQLDNHPNINIFGSSYSHEISPSNESENVYTTSDLSRSPSHQSLTAQKPSHRQPSHVYSMDNPLRPPSSRPARPIYRIGALTLLLTILCAGALLASLIYFAPAHSLLNMLPNPAIMVGGATVTITPARPPITSTYTIQAVPNATPDPNQRQIAARPLSSQQTQTSTVKGTGHNQTTATAAKGTVTFFDGSTNSFTVAAGTQLQAANGVTIITDAAAVIPTAKPIQGTLGETSVPAHAATGGTSGNIPAGSINGTCCTSGNFIQAKNEAAFTGGQDAKNYTFVQPGDVNTFLNSVQPQLTQQATAALTTQLKPGEHLAQSPNCSPATRTSNPIGDQGQNIPSTTVTVTVTCTAISYDQNGLRALVTNLLQQQARASIGPHYALQDPIAIHVQNQQINPDNSLTLLVNASGLYTYQLSAARQQQLARLIAGKPVDVARKLLQAQPGVRAVAISTSGAALPGDPALIQVTYQNANH
jgi:serine/threonine protein kinase